MSAIDWITIRGFKSLARIERLSLRQINILIGANGSGKSNFIEVLALLHALSTCGLRNYVLRSGGAKKLVHFGPTASTQITIEVSLMDENHQYLIELNLDESDNLFVSQESVQTWIPSRTGHPSRIDLRAGDREAAVGRHDGPHELIDFLRNYLGKLRVYRFHDTSSLSAMKKIADLHDNRFLLADGLNLAAFLYHLKLNHGQSFKKIRSVVRLAAPFIGDFELTPMDPRETTIQLRWRHSGSDVHFDESDLSDGTLRFIALVTLLLQPPRYQPPVIILDEPVVGLHPAAVVLLASLIKKAAINSQIVVATQSSHLLDHFDPEDVLVANREEGATTLTRLRSDNLNAWLEDYSLGQLWEKNEIGGRPLRERMG